jgi:hypothetical protein
MAVWTSPFRRRTRVAEAPQKQGRSRDRVTFSGVSRELGGIADVIRENHRLPSPSVFEVTRPVDAGIFDEEVPLLPVKGNRAVKTVALVRATLRVFASRPDGSHRFFPIDGRDLVFFWDRQMREMSCYEAGHGDPRHVGTVYLHARLIDWDAFVRLMKASFPERTRIFDDSEFPCVDGFGELLDRPGFPGVHWYVMRCTVVSR